MTTQQKRKRDKRIDELAEDYGFDLSRAAESGNIRIRCSQCQAMTVNGVPIHEKGCPNEKFPKENNDDDR